MGEERSVTLEKLTASAAVTEAESVVVEEVEMTSVSDGFSEATLQAA